MTLNDTIMADALIMALHDLIELGVSLPPQAMAEKAAEMVKADSSYMEMAKEANS